MSVVGYTRRFVLAAGASAIGVGGCASRDVPAPGLQALPRTRALIDAARTQRQSGQIFAAGGGRTLLDEGIGPQITPETLVAWASACKPTTVAAVMRLVDAGRVGLDQRVATLIPEFAAADKEAITLRHLMTHTAALGGYLGPTTRESFAQTIARICAAPREFPRAARARITAQRGQAVGNPAGTDDSLPPLGVRPSYNPAGIWILGEVLQRVHTRPFSEVIRTELYQPLAMSDCWNGMSVERFDAYGAQISTVGRVAAPQTGRDFASIANPAGGALGPCRQLARFYQMALNGGTLDGVPILKPDTLADMTRVQASDGEIWTFGLGFHLNARGTAPADPSSPEARLRYGARPSLETFGHNGATGLTAFADPRHNLVVVMTGLSTRVSDALYDDLGLT